MFKNFTLPILVALLLIFPVTSFADSILLFGDNASEMSQLGSVLTAQGHTVTNNGNTLAGNLNSFDTVWGLRTNSAYDESPLVSYIQNGGRAYLTGENSGAANESVSNMLATLTGFSLIYGQIDSSGNSNFNSGAVGNIDASPNPLNAIAGGNGIFIQGGGVIQGLNDNNVFIELNGSLPFGAVFDESDMLTGQGRLVTIADVDWFRSDVTGSVLRSAVIENIQTFLGDGAVSQPVPEPSTLLLSLLGLSLFLAEKKR